MDVEERLGRCHRERRDPHLALGLGGELIFGRRLPALDRHRSKQHRRGVGRPLEHEFAPEVPKRGMVEHERVGQRILPGRKSQHGPLEAAALRRGPQLAERLPDRWACVGAGIGTGRWAQAGFPDAWRRRVAGRAERRCEEQGHEEQGRQAGRPQRMMQE